MVCSLVSIYFDSRKGLISKISVMTSHVYNTRNKPISTIEENISSEANFEASESFVTSDSQPKFKFGKEIKFKVRWFR